MNMSEGIAVAASGGKFGSHSWAAQRVYSLQAYQKDPTSRFNAPGSWPSQDCAAGCRLESFASGLLERASTVHDLDTTEKALTLALAPKVPLKEDCHPVLSIRCAPFRTISAEPAEDPGTWDAAGHFGGMASVAYPAWPAPRWDGL